MIRNALTVVYCTLRGTIKNKTVLYMISAMKYQVHCIENTAWWLTNTVQLC